MDNRVADGDDSKTMHKNRSQEFDPSSLPPVVPQAPYHEGYPPRSYDPQSGYYTHAPPPQVMHPMHQMSSTSTTTVVVNQPQTISQPKLLVTSLHGVRDWSSGLCGCFEDVESCLCTFCCPSCQEAKNFRRAGESACLPCCCPMYMTIVLRTKVRVMGEIKGSICNDYCAVSCCYPCVICQIHRELNAMGLQ